MSQFLLVFLVMFYHIAIVYALSRGPHKSDEENEE